VPSAGIGFVGHYGMRKFPSGMLSGFPGVKYIV
jgi:hypothetical protein